MKPGKYVVFAAVTFVSSSGLSAAVYKSVDSQGNVVYTDEPGGDAKPVKLPPLSTVPAPRYKSSTQSPMDLEPSAVANYQKISIVSPTQDATLRDNTGAVPVDVVVEPALNSVAGHRFRYYLDGQAQGKPTESGQISFANLDRGSHTVEAAVVDNAGRELIRSGSVQFFLHRQSVNFPTGPAAPAPAPVPIPIPRRAP
jgi:hypothetical protein